MPVELGRDGTVVRVASDRPDDLLPIDDGRVAEHLCGDQTGHLVLSWRFIGLSLAARHS
jgi:hypothetical protein